MVSISRDPFFLSALESDHALPTEQALANAAIIAIFAYLVPLLTMEINFFRLAVYRSWRRDELKMKRKQRKRKQQQQTNAEHGVAIEMSLMRVPSTNNDDTAADAGGDLPRNQTRSSEVLLDSNNSTHSTSSKDNLLQPNSNINIDNDINNTIDSDDNGDDSSSSSSSASAVGHLITSISTALHDVTSITTLHLNSPRSHSHSSSHNHHHQLPINSPSLQAAYHTIRTSSMQAILSSLVVYTITAVGVAYNTRGLDEKVVAIIVGTSQFMASMMVFIVSAKVPQWIGVYHQGSIRLVKCSSSYSEQFTKLKLSNDTTLQKLKYNVRLGVWFHFAKFYIICMPFYCGVQEATIPISIVSGSLFGFVLMWAVFVVHEKYIQHRNIVSFTTILLLTIVSSLAFVRGMAWIQVVWRLDILKNEDTLLVIYFFAWLALLVGVHTLFLWHTLRTEEAEKNNKKNAAAMMAEEHEEEEEEEEEEEVTNHDLGASTHTNKLGNRKGKSTMRRNSSYSSFVFDPRIHFKDGKCQFSDHPDAEVNDSLTHELSMDAPLSSNDQANDDDGDVHTMQDYYIETPIVADNADNDGNVVQMEFNDDDDELDNEETATPSEKISQSNNNSNNHQTKKHQIRRERPTWCTVFICFTPEYEQSSTLWKILCWIKIIILTLSYLLCLYFVIICIGATYQVNTVRAALPAVQEALYNHMDEGEVCAFDNRGPDSNITTFANKDAAHDAGFLIVHCGACEACSSWENLIKEWTTRDTMAALANHCAKESLFGGGDDAITECLMNPETIGFGYECAVCWAEDIVCTKEHCTFIFLQSQMINNVGNFAVGENAITSANCEEAHCEVGQFVPCSGATRRRMNIVSSISRPGNQQCGIVDVGDWEDLFFGSGVVQK